MDRLIKKDMKKFRNSIANMELIQFIGLAKMLNVEFCEDNDIEKLRDIEDVMLDMFMAFGELKPEVRQEIIKIAKKSESRK